MTRAAPLRPAALAVAAILLLVTCAPPETPEAVPFPEVRSPEIRIGLLTGAARVEATGDSGLAMLDGEGASLAVTEPGIAAVGRLAGGRLSLAPGAGQQLAVPQSITVVPRKAGGLVYLNGKAYRGMLQLAPDRSGITVVNRVELEAYLAGVVGAEMGRRDTADAEALAAQAIVSRTFAIRNLGKRATEGFDLYATVVDQVYGGVSAEYPLARWAVARTAGQILTWQGLPIDAFFYSTCGGRTATGTEVFAAADRPYLQSVSDTDGGGAAYCRISPRFRWREEWSAEQLSVSLRQSLPRLAGTVAEDIAPVSGVTITRRTGSDRVARLTFALRRGTATVEGPSVRQALRPVGEGSLRSALFQLIETRTGGRLTHLVAEGAGAGHGVGMCQWGAVGRARAGQDAAAILGVYFPGTELRRAY
ncbi:MAG: SpoIID/LytB domain-containing protein [Gemmatimonadota bacterium]|nr:SpoIID/LytB domain-containing protein [Gemmatimonadota bacterium]